MNRITLLSGHVLNQLLGLPDNSVHCVVTSPPYWGLRDYGIEPVVWGGEPGCPGHEWGEESIVSSGRNDSGEKRHNFHGQKAGYGGNRQASQGQFCLHCGAWRGSLGLEPTIELFVEHIVEIFREVRRVLRPDGVCFVNLGDSMSVGSNLLNEINSIQKVSPLFFRNTATITITSHRRDISLNNNGFPNDIFFSLLGVERIIIKQRNNNFCQVLNTFGMPGYCRINAPVCFAAMNSADLEIVIDSGDDISIVVSEHDSNTQSELGIFGTASTGARKNSNSSFPIKKTAKPITEIICDGETIGDAVSFNSPLERLPDIYFINHPIAFRDSPLSFSGHSGNFRITKALPQEVHFSFGNFGINLRAVNVSHLYLQNHHGSFLRYKELYETANRKSNEKKAKQELGIPDLVKRALMQDGWICRLTIIWSKSNPMPESVTDRPTRAHEYIFLLTKSARYHWDQEAVREEGCGRLDRSPMSKGRLGSVGKQYREKQPDIEFSNGRNLRSVWTIATAPFPEAHFATFPPKLVETCIKAGTSEHGVCPKCGAPWVRVVEKKAATMNIRVRDEKKGILQHKTPGHTATDEEIANYGPEHMGYSQTLGFRPSCKCADNQPIPATVLDPFGGSGTVGLVAAKMGRNAILIEMKPEYCDMARKRWQAEMGFLVEIHD